MVQIDTDHFEWRQETVINALLQRVFVNRFTEISDVGNIFCFFRRCRHTDLDRRIEIFEHNTPSSVIGGTSTMALVNDDQIKEISWELVVDRFTIFSTHDCLIQAEINLIRLIDFAVVFINQTSVKLCHDITKRFEIIHHRLINQNVAVS